MKKYLIRIALLFTLVATLLGVSGPVMAQQLQPYSEVCSSGSASDATVCQPQSSGNPIVGKDGILTKVIIILDIVIGIASVVMIIVGGLRYVLSSGDSNNTNSARNTVLYAIVGLVVALMARAIILFVISKL